MTNSLLVGLRRLLIFGIVVVFAVIAAVLAYGNQEPIALDLGFIRLENVSLTVTLAITFCAGAVFGGLIMAMTLLRHFRERRALRRSLKRAESELESRRSLPLHDAD